MWQGVLNKVFKIREKVAMNLGGAGDEEKPFLEHLEDLRTMLMRMAITLLVTAIGTFCFYKALFQAIMMPLWWAGIAKDAQEAMTILINTDPSGAFMTAVNVSLIAAVILAFPILLMFLMQFVMPGLKDTEKKLVFPVLAVGAGLFLTGVAFSYRLVLPRALEFFNEFGTDLGVKQMWTLDQYITFSTRFILIFGVSFELPVLVMALVKLDFLSYSVMKKTWKHALVVVFIFAAVITPTQDVLTLALLAGPLYVLYLICIWLAYLMEKKERQLYPEFYAEQDKDAAELEKPVTEDWDNENYNPWFSDSEPDEEDDEYKKSRPSPSAPPPEVEKRNSTQSEDLNSLADNSEDQGSQVVDEPEPSATDAKPSTEKTTEELSREDEQRSGNPPA